MYSLRLYLDNPRNIVFPWLFLAFFLLVSPSRALSQAAESLYGPENLLKTLANPFNSHLANPEANSETAEDALAPLAIKQQSHTLQIHSLRERFNSPKLFLPERINIGKTAEFLIKAPPGMYAAIAMADKNSGAKPIFAHHLRLGSDRKVVAVGKVPESGILSLFVEAPIQGDLIGESLYFEAAIWSKPDFSDLQMATAISPQQTEKEENAVVIAGDGEPKKRGLFVFDQPKPISAREYPGSVSRP